MVISEVTEFRKIVRQETVSQGIINHSLGLVSFTFDCPDHYGPRFPVDGNLCNQGAVSVTYLLLEEHRDCMR